MLQDFADGAFVLDRRDQSHPSAAASTGQNVEVKGAAHQRGPGQAALSTGIVGTVGISRRPRGSASHNNVDHMFTVATADFVKLQAGRRVRQRQRLMSA